ncbi:MAG: response regulator [Gammaproteobacteria bacterium]|nr:response regulator [Gammaproteobacteria bacterium]MBU1731110.1 response regulator [Gammaproteobacteria bacterium]MBU1894174.1 response regulator [Gammaproteobacteria bacterium]
MAALRNAKDAPVDFQDKTFLVIDDIIGVRSSMRITISTFGGVKVDMAANAADAFNKIEHRNYDIILCDYSLGEAKDGQQLLEELKRRRMIRNATIFMMVTAERGYEKVVSAVELAPDDYLIKPFSGEVLRTRLQHLIHKKTFLAPIYELMERQEMRKAAELCDRLLSKAGPYLLDVLRLKGELLLMISEFTDASKVYEHILAMREIPWARMGLAQAQYFLENYEAAAEGFKKILAGHPNYLSAYDWLAKAYTALGDEVSAQRVLMDGVAKSPRTLQRQKDLGESAYQNEDLDTAQGAFEAVLEFGKFSSFTEPEDFANLSRTFLDKGEYDQALTVMNNARKTFENSPQVMLHASVMDSMIHDKAGNKEAAERAFGEARTLFDAAVNKPESLALDMVRSCFQHGDQAAGEKITQELVKNNHDNPAVLKRTEQMFQRMGMHDQGKDLIHTSSREVIALNNRAVKLAQAGDLKGSVELLMQAADQLRANNVVVLNAAHAILTYLGQTGWDERLANIVHEYLDTVKQRDPQHKKYLSLSAIYKDLALKFGVKV